MLFNDLEFLQSHRTIFQTAKLQKYFIMHNAQSIIHNDNVMTLTAMSR